MNDLPEPRDPRGRCRPALTRLSVATALSLGLAALAAGCAIQTWAPSVPVGASRADVLRTMGTPTATYTMPDGHERLEYNHMPSGRQTYMLDLDATGRLAGWAQVLDDAHFQGIQPGMDRQDVLRRLGPPSDKGYYARPTPADTWLYRYDSVPKCFLFRVSFDVTTGRVESTDFPPDPTCPGEFT